MTARDSEIKTPISINRLKQTRKLLRKAMRKANSNQSMRQEFCHLNAIINGKQELYHRNFIANEHFTWNIFSKTARRK